MLKETFLFRRVRQRVGDFFCEYKINEHILDAKNKIAPDWDSGGLASGNDSVNVYDNFKKLLYLCKFLISSPTRSSLRPPLGFNFNNEATFFAAECAYHLQESQSGDRDLGVFYAGTSDILKLGGLLLKDSAILLLGNEYF